MESVFGAEGVRILHCLFCVIFRDHACTRTEAWPFCLLLWERHPEIKSGVSCIMRPTLPKAPEFVLWSFFFFLGGGGGVMCVYAFTHLKAGTSLLRIAPAARAPGPRQTSWEPGSGFGVEGLSFDEVQWETPASSSEPEATV